MMSHRLTRRSFLATTAASMTLPLRGLTAAEDARQEIPFLVITDTHVGYQGQESAARQWEKMAAELAKQEGAFVLHLGDVVDGGREEQYPIYLKTREAVGKPIYEIPGNHDPQPLFEKYIRRPVDSVFDHRWLRVVMFNDAHTDSHDGFVAREQLDWLERQVIEAKENSLAVIVAMHVPAHSNQHPDRGWHVRPTNGQAEFYDIVTRTDSPVIALFHGHFHNGLRGWEDRRPIHEICFPSALYNQDRQLEEKKSAGYNPAEFRPGFVSVTLRRDALALAYRPLGANSVVTRECSLAR